MFPYQMLVLFAVVCNVYSNETTSSCQKETVLSYLDIAADMISKAKLNIPSCNGARNCTQRPIDCSDLLHFGYNKSGVYTIWPVNRVTENKALDVYCDMETDGGGWTVIQRRGDFSRPKEYFFKVWKEYKEGFGNIEEDFWLGNDNIFALTNQKQYSIRFDLEDVESNKAYALYDSFWIDDEDYKYTLHISDYSGNAGDSMTPRHNNQKFSTYDQENDIHKELNCAQKYKGAWWYDACHYANLNGFYLDGKHESEADGVNWYYWKGHRESLKSTEMKIRPKKFLWPMNSH